MKVCQLNIAPPRLFGGGIICLSSLETRATPHYAVDIGRGWLLKSLDSVNLDPRAHHLLVSLLPIRELRPLRVELRLIYQCPIHLVALPHCEGGDIREPGDRSIQIIHVLVPATTLRGVLLVLRVVGGGVISFHFLILTNYNSKTLN